MKRLLVPVLVGALGVAATPPSAAPPALDLPAVLLPGPETLAVALAAGRVHRSADATAEVRMPLEAGQVVVYYGATTDAFGRPWSVIGDPEAHRSEQTWLVLPEVFRGSPPTGAPLAFLRGLGAPPVSGESERVVRVRSGWWREIQPLTLLDPPQMGELLGVPAYRLPQELVEETVRLIGGREALGPWPEEPVLGQIHVSPRLPIVWIYDGDWSAGDRPRTLSPTPGLLPNPALVVDRRAPREPTGFTLPCWRLVGALDPVGIAVGRIGEAPEEPARVPGAARPDDPLGATDLTARAWPVADEEMAAPRRLLLQEEDPGVELADNSARQAVYLEQILPAATTRLLRGRELRLRVLARAMPGGESTSSVAVSIELIAGSERVSHSQQVGLRAAPLTVTLVVPEDAESVIARLIPQDRSIAVQERGTVVFDSAALAPVDWPVELTPDPLRLRRALVVGYGQARGFTRAPLAISTRGEEDLRSAWRGLERSDRDDETRRHILAGELRTGMSAADVGLAWGEPLARSFAGSLDRWDWADRSAAFGEDGVLVSWTRHAQPPEVLPAACAEPRGTVVLEGGGVDQPQASAMAGERS